MTRRFAAVPQSRIGTLLLCAALLTVLALAAPRAARADACSTPVTNPVACENSKTGNDPSEWEVDGEGSSTIQGFATTQSVNKGETVSFKIKSTTSAYHIDIYRLGYYGGSGARLWQGNLAPTNTATQGACQVYSDTGLIDCGNWSVSRTWTVPSDAVSGVYEAHLVRNDGNGDSKILFVVRDDASHADLLVSTSDATWQAYNSYGGNSLYVCTVSCPTPTTEPLAYKAAYKVSYNRPLDTEDKNPRSAFFTGGEYPMVRFLEANGYNMAYTSSSDVGSRPTLLLNHKIFMSSGHDEYWSGTQRSAVEAARDAGVNLAFFSGNEIYWRTRWENSVAGTSTPNRTLVAYKDTHFPSQQDPVSWTGTWSDPRFASAADNVKPQNALTGQEFIVNAGTADIKVPQAFGKLRLWRGTQAATLGTNQTLTLAPDTLGYEWDVDADNGFRPAGTIDLSSTTVSELETFTDYGSYTQENDTATHNMTLYKAPSGALVFGAGTVQWSWGLDKESAAFNDPDTNMQQATLNLLADMSAQPYAPLPGLTRATKSTDTTAPTATITSKPSTAADGSKVTLAGTATDSGGGIVAGVEVSTDNGTTWHPATGTSSWSYSWTVHGAPTATIKVRATDDSANMQSSPTTATVAVTCPCSVWGTSVTPTNTVADDPSPVEVGVKFKSDTYGAITGVRFYKQTGNSGTHIGSLWASDGTRLATATFGTESATGWQTVTFPTPVPVMPGQTYVASYYAPNGNYTASANYFWKNPAPVPQGGAVTDSAPLHFPKGSDTGVYSYSYTGTSTFPSSSYSAGNYWVDVTWQPIAAAGQATGVVATGGRGSATVSWTAPTSGGTPSSYIVTPYVGTTARTATTISGTPVPTTATITGLTPGTTYTFKVTATNPTGSGPASNSSNAVTPTAPTAPTAATGVSAEPATSSARVSWTTPTSDGGSPITAYKVTPYIGTTAQTATTASASATSATITGLTNGTAYTFKVTATNAIGSTVSDPSALVSPAASIFDLNTPSIVDGGDGSSVELGVKFKSDVFGAISGLRFYKAAGNTGTHVGTLWTAGGTLLARATFTNESASGWQRVTFDQPVAVTAGTTYVASYFAPVGHYSVTPAGLATGADNGGLHAIANTSSPNGLYVYNGVPTFPTESYNSSNYFVDVMFAPLPVPGTVTGVTATAAKASADVSWTAPATGGTPTSYEVVPYVGTTAQATRTVTGSPLPTSTTVTGLTNGTTYTFKVRAVNPAGNGTQSAASNAVTPFAPTAPDAPSGVTVATGNASAQLTWTAPAANGSAITGYTVTPYVGGSAQTPVSAPASATSATVSGLTNGAAYTFKVKATNAIGSTDSAATAVETPGRTLLDYTSPAMADVNDNDPVELGVKFKTDLAGQITGLRFYKSTNNTGTHVGTLWSATGTQLARATFTGESGSGWQTVDFSSPVDVAAGTTYIASYNAPRGHYSATSQGFANPLDNGQLHTIADGVSANGVFGYSANPVFPTSSFNATNYWVDVLFTAMSAPNVPTGATAVAGKSSADVSWTAPAGGTTPTSYEVVPYIGSVAQTSKVVTGTPLPTSTTVNGLTTGTAYTFKVRAINAAGNGPLSGASNAVTPFSSTPPDAPTGVTAAAGAASAKVSWTVPASDGGSTISGYTITPYVGSTAQATTTASGAATTSAVVTGLTNGTAYTFTVRANTPAGSGTSDPTAVAVTPGTTLLDFTTPTMVDAGDADAIELGVKFTSDVDGRVTGLRFYKSAANTGTHIATLWTAGGTALARATFTGESATGWQTVDFDSPVTVTAGTTYVASYRAPNGHYSATGQGFAVPVDSAPLHSIANAVSPNGMYAYVYNTNPVFPYGDFNATNYWVDVLFTAGAGS